MAHIRIPWLQIALVVLAFFAGFWCRGRGEALRRDEFKAWLLVLHEQNPGLVVPELPG